MNNKQEKKTMTSNCRDCGKQFELSLNEQKFYKLHNLELQRRCAECRRKRKEAKQVEKNKKATEERIRKAEADEIKLQQLLKLLPFEQTQITELEMANPAKSLVIIGNGFDIMHGVKSSYWDFQKTIGKNSSLRFYMETYLDTGDLWSNLEDSLRRLNYSIHYPRLTIRILWKSAISAMPIGISGIIL